MNPSELGAALLVGLLGSGHCVVMCGGINSALESTVAAQNVSPSVARCGFHSGRLLGYAFVGLMVGSIGSAAMMVLPVADALWWGRQAQAAVLVLLGLYLCGLWRAPLTALERWGAHLWRALAPLRSKVFPIRSFGAAARMGMLWGFLPCGLVYSALALALVSGGAVDGAVTMLAFGVGTVPALLLVSGAARRFSTWVTHRGLRAVTGLVVIVGGLSIATHAM